MRNLMNKMKRVSRFGSAQSTLRAASAAVLEPMEKRMLMSTSTVTDWTFDNDAVAITSNPAPSIGAGTAQSIGMQTTGTYGTGGASGTGDASNVLVGALNNGANDYSSTGSAGDGNAWRVVGTSDGWSSNAAIGSQGAQYMVSTVGEGGISLKFDLDASSGKAPGEFQVQYTTDGSTWINDPNIAIGVGSNGTTDGLTIATNSAVSTIVSGTYYQFANNADALWWQNGLTASFPAAANNDSNFGVRIVNAATGVSEYEVTGTGAALTAYPAVGAGNVRFDNVQILASGTVTSAPSITAQPSNQMVAAGSSVTFTAAAAGYPVPIVQWQANSGSGFVNISGATSNSYSFTTSSTAADNGTEYQAIFTNSQGTATTSYATLNDTLAAPTITTQPTAQTVTAGNSVTFSVVATGSPSPTYQWRSSSTLSGTYTSVGSSGTSATYTFVPSSSQNGTYYYVVVTNSQGSNISAGVLLTVNATPITTWSFSTIIAAPYNSPATTTGTGTATSLGFTNTYAVPAVTTPNSVTSDDITSVAANNSSGTPVTEDDWRVRGAYSGTGSGGTTKNINGWDTAAPQYSQGVEFDVSTVNYTGIKASFDWEATSSGVRDLQEQYNLNITNSAGWTNINALLVSPSGGGYVTGSAIDLSSITGANNDANFGIRLVSAYDPTYTGTGAPTYTSATLVSGASTPINNTSGNWGFDNIIISGTHAAVAPTIATQPTNQTVLTGATATFTTAANAAAFPTPTVQWYQGTPTGTNSAISGATSNTFNVSSTTLAQSGTTYFAIFSNVNGTATTNVVTLTVDSSPVISTQPVSTLTVTVGNPASITAAETTTADVGITTQWQTSTGSTWTNITGATNNSTGTTSSTYSFYPSIEQTGNMFRATFTSSYGTIYSNATTLTVLGVPVTQWNFTSGVGPLPVATQGSSPANSPPASLSNNPTTDSASILGLSNDYSTPYSALIAGTINQQSYPEADILPERSTINSSFNEYVWRVRGGLGTGATGAPGNTNANGWSQNAPEYVFAGNSSSPYYNPGDIQGVQFNVNTTGYSDITLHFDWNQGGIGDMQAQYSPDGGTTWVNVGSLIQATSTDYVGITATTNPTGVTVNLQGITAADNNPNFALRLVAAYDPGLPSITDGNALDPTVHGQYGAAGWGPTSAVQTLTLGTNTGSSYTLNFNGNTTAPITYYGNTYADQTENAMAIQIALDALTGIGAGGVTVVPSDENINPQGQIVATLYTATFTAKAAQPTMTASDGNINVATTVDGVAATTTTTTTAAYTLTAGVSTNIVVAATTNFAAGDTVVIDGKGVLITAINATTNTLTITPQASDNIALGQTVILEGVSAYANGGGSWALGNISFNGIVGTPTGTGTTVTLTGPSTLVQPTSVTVPGSPVSSTVSFTATDYSEPAAGSNTVAWYVNKNDGHGYVPVTGGTVTNSNVSNGTTSNELTSTYSFTGVLPSNGNGGYVGNGFTYEAFFTNAAGTTDSYPALLTVVTPQAPAPATLQDVSVQAGNVAVFSSSATGVPSPSAQWQMLVNGIWTNVSNTAATVIVTTSYSASITTTLSIQNALQSLDATQYRVVYSSLVGTINTNPATLHVLANETVITDWNFASYNTSSVPVNNPLPTSGVINPGNPNTYVGTASMAGMTLAYNPGDPATGTDGYGTIPDGDISSTPGALNPNFSENTWRIRAGDAQTGVAGSPANGWSNNALQYTQGVQFMVPTNGYGSVYVTMDWYATTSGILDARQQYTLDGGATWFNLDDHQLACTVNLSTGQQNGNLDPNDPFPTVQAVSNDYYGATANGGPIPLVFNLSGIVGATNNPNFGIRLTSAYNAILTAQNNGVGTYANAALVGSPAGPAQYNGNKGNWRFDNIVFHGDPTWLAPTSAATWDEYTQTLTVTGSATIINDPATSPISNSASLSNTNGTSGVTTVASGDYPIIVGTAAVDQLAINTGTVSQLNIGGLELSGGAVVTVATTVTPSTILLVKAGGPLAITGTSSLNLGDSFADFQATSATGQSTAQNVNSLVASGYAAHWTGSGIDSSAAASDGTYLTSLGVLFNYLSTTGTGLYGSSATGPFAAFDGFTPGAYDTLVRYTYYGDANLDGKVDGSDYSLVDNGFAHAATGWGNGDLNYDGIINGSDYTLIDNAFNRQNGTPLAAVAGPSATPAAMVAGPVAKTAKAKTSHFAIGLPFKGVRFGTFVPTALTAATPSIEDLLKHDKRNIFAGSLLDGSKNI